MSSENSSNRNPGGHAASTKPERLYKVAFDLPERTADWANASVERLWAGKTSRQMEVQIRNTPFYVKGVSLGDVVRVRPDHERRELVFEEFVSEGGHSTIRVIISDDSARDSIEATISEYECPWEIDSTGYLWAIDIPPSVDYSAIRNSLLVASGEGKIGIEEGSISRAHRDGLGLPPADQ
ncbi:DUF4265 domain-containing protein [Kitasatospora sp. cg17-2]